MNIRIDHCTVREQFVVVVPLMSEMALRRRRADTRLAGGTVCTDHFAIVGFHDEDEARAWSPDMKDARLRIVGPFRSLQKPTCSVGCCGE